MICSTLHGSYWKINHEFSKKIFIKMGKPVFGPSHELWDLWLFCSYNISFFNTDIMNVSKGHRNIQYYTTEIPPQLIKCEPFWVMYNFFNIWNNHKVIIMVGKPIFCWVNMPYPNVLICYVMVTIYAEKGCTEARHEHILHTNSLKNRW